MTFPLQKLSLALFKVINSDSEDEGDPFQRSNYSFTFSKFIRNHKSTLTELKLEGNFDNETYKTVFNDLRHLIELSLRPAGEELEYSGLEPNLSVETFEFGFQDNFARNKPFPKAFIKNLPNVNDLQCSCVVSEEYWTLINSCMPKLETISIDPHGAYRGVDLVFPTVKKCVFDDLAYDENIVKTFPNLESLVIFVINYQDETKMLHRYASSLIKLKLLTIYNLEPQLNLEKLLQTFDMSSTLETLSIPKDSLCFDTSLSKHKLLTQIRKLKSSTTFTELQMIIKKENSTTIDENIEICESSEQQQLGFGNLELLPYDIFNEIYKFVTKDDVKNLLLVSKRFDISFFF